MTVLGFTDVREALFMASLHPSANDEPQNGVKAAWTYYPKLGAWGWV